MAHIKEHTPQVAPAEFLDALSDLFRARTMGGLRDRTSRLKAALESNRFLPRSLDGRANGSATLSRRFLEGELRQIGESRTIQRARYYLERLRNAIGKVRMTPVNDINLNRWKEYNDILTDSLWILDRRDVAGPHSAWYWGNFVPQIPHQLMLRYTKRGEWVLDPFAGSGTTLLEAQRLGRHCIGIELQAEIARRARRLLRKGWDGIRPESNLTCVLEVGDSTTVDFRSLLRRHGASSVQLAILHPPYHDIIRFSRRRNDLSNARTVEEFVSQFGRVVDKCAQILDRGRYLAVVIGDKYERGEWIPLGFLLTEEVRKRPFRLKSIVVKNFDSTLAKRRQRELWRYRALAGGFYVFKHEYLLIFQHTGRPSPIRAGE